MTHTAAILTPDADLSARLRDLGARIDTACAKHGITRTSFAKARAAQRERELIASLRKFGALMDRAATQAAALNRALTPANDKMHF